METNFFSGLVNQPLLDHVDHFPHVDILTANMTMLFGNISPALQSFYEAAYDDEINERRPQYMSLQPLNSSQVYFIFKFLLRNNIFKHYTPLCQCMIALVGHPGFGRQTKSRPWSPWHSRSCGIVLHPYYEPESCVDSEEIRETYGFCESC